MSKKNKPGYQRRNQARLARRAAETPEDKEKKIHAFFDKSGGNCWCPCLTCLASEERQQKTHAYFDTDQYRSMCPCNVCKTMRDNQIESVVLMAVDE